MAAPRLSRGCPGVRLHPALVALLRRRLTDQEVQDIAAEVLNSPDWPVNRTDIQVMITEVTDEMPSQADLRRVLSHKDPPSWPTGSD